MKLGEMLLRDGRLTEQQLDAALRYQARDGGRLGTILVEHGFVDFEALTIYLGLQLGIPIATGATLARAKRAAVRLLQPGQAFKHKCVPLVVQDRQLIAAVDDPHDFARLDALAQITGYRVLPRVAPEVRIYYYIERYYGVPRPERFGGFGDAPRHHDGSAVDAGLPAPPLPGLPPTTATPIAPPGPRPRLQSAKMERLFDDSEPQPAGAPADEPAHEPASAQTKSGGTRTRGDGAEDLELDAEELLVSLDAEAEAPAEPVPLTAKPEPSVPTLPSMPAAPVTPMPMTADAALRELATADDRNRIVEILLAYSVASFDAAVVFTVRDHMAFGWKAVGALEGYANVEHLLIPLDMPSVLQSGVAAESGLFHGLPAPSTVNSYFYKVMQCAEPPTVSVGVIRLGKRIANIFYGHGPAMTPLQLDVMRLICDAAAEAYTRLIAVTKRSGNLPRLEG
ncbi:MAG TPA: hypothetical protein VNO30_45115 [Kofleriaceae bacterium]|nr:hypothetical protein [Kofleriaceae bacterium]